MTAFDDAFEMTNQDDAGYVPEVANEYGDPILDTFPCNCSSVRCGYTNKPYVGSHAQGEYNRKRHQRWRWKGKPKPYRLCNRRMDYIKAKIDEDV